MAMARWGPGVYRQPIWNYRHEDGAPVSVWGGSDGFSAGTIEITTAVDDPERSGGPVVFDPTRVVDGIELSDDPILRYRPVAYSESVARRTAP